MKKDVNSYIKNSHNETIFLGSHSADNINIVSLCLSEKIIFLNREEVQSLVKELTEWLYDTMVNQEHTEMVG